MNAIILAGGIPQAKDPLYRFANGNPKALIDIAGRPMIQWVLDAMGDTRKVNSIIIEGLSSKNTLTCKKPLYYLSNQGNMSANITAAANMSRTFGDKNKFVLIVPSSISALQTEIIDWFITTAMQTKHDFYCCFCTRQTMEKTAPSFVTNYIKLKDVEVCNTNVYIVNANFIVNRSMRWGRLLEKHNGILPLTTPISWDPLSSLLLRRITLQEAITRFTEQTGIKGRAIICPYPEIGMDIDKPHQLELVRSDLTRQLRKSARMKTSARKAKAKAKAKSSLKSGARAKPTRKSAAAKKRTSAAKSKTVKKAPVKKPSKPKAKARPTKKAPLKKSSRPKAKSVKKTVSKKSTRKTATKSKARSVSKKKPARKTKKK